MRLPFGGRRVGSRFRVAQRSSPWRLEGDLDAVAVEVPQIDRLGHEMVRRRYLHVTLQRPHRELCKVRPLGNMDCNVIEPSRPLYDGTHGTGLEYDQSLAVHAQGNLIVLLGDHRETDHFVPDGKRLRPVGDREPDRAQRSAQGQRWLGANAGLGFDGEDHLRLHAVAPI
jgi:hypothetical protein